MAFPFPNVPDPNLPPCWVISMNTPEGGRRRSRLNFEHVIKQGFAFTEIPSGFASKMGKGRYSEKNYQSITGSFYSHYMLWVELSQLEIPGVCICEDDAHKIRKIPQAFEDAPGLILFGGAVRGPGIWEKEVGEWVKTGQFWEVLKSFTNGLNDVSRSTFRWTMAISYYITPAVAKQLVDKVHQSSKKLKVVDVWLGESTMVKQLLFPPAFTDHPDSISQCNSPPAHQQADFYMAFFLRKAAAKKGVSIPGVGGTYDAWRHCLQIANIVPASTDICLHLVFFMCDVFCLISCCMFIVVVVFVLACNG